MARLEKPMEKMHGPSHAKRTFSQGVRIDQAGRVSSCRHQFVKLSESRTASKCSTYPSMRVLSGCRRLKPDLNVYGQSPEAGVSRARALLTTSSPNVEPKRRRNEAMPFILDASALLAVTVLKEPGADGVLDALNSRGPDVEPSTPQKWRHACIEEGWTDVLASQRHFPGTARPDPAVRPQYCSAMWSLPTPHRSFGPEPRRPGLPSHGVSASPARL